jgi:hypothetical protein
VREQRKCDVVSAVVVIAQGAAGHEIDLAHFRSYRELWQGRYPDPHRPAEVLNRW